MSNICKKMVVDGKTFPMPKNEKEYDKKMQVTCIVFEKDSDYEDFVSNITKALGIGRWNHSLGIDFAFMQIIYPTENPPTLMNLF